MFQKNEFRAELVRKGMSVKSIARALKLTTASIYRKMNGYSDFYRTEIEKIAELLELSESDIIKIFFA